MKRIQIWHIILLGTMILFILAGCGSKVLITNAFSIEDEAVSTVEIETQGNLTLDVLDGDIKVTFWQEDYLEITEKRTVRGPAKKEKLKELLEKNKYFVESTEYSISVSKPQDPDKKDAKEGKSIISITNDLEIMVPESIKFISIKAGSGNISISGRDISVPDQDITGRKLVSNVDVRLKNGNIKIDGLEAAKINVNAAKGDILVSEITGNGEFKCDRGKIAVGKTAGNITAKLTEGEINIEEAEGRLNCDVSSGAINIKSSWLLKDSVFYVSTGEINADFEARDEEGKVKFMAAKGDILLNLPEKSGWSLIAKSTKGRVTDRQKPKREELKTSPSGEVYGDVAGGGLLIDAYVDNGNIYLQNS